MLPPRRRELTSPAPSRILRCRDTDGHGAALDPDLEAICLNAISKCLYLLYATMG